MIVLLPDAQFADDAAIERACLGPGARILTRRAGRPEEIPDADWAVAEAVLLSHVIAIDDGVLDRAPKLRIVVRHGVGYDRIDLAACGARNVAVCNVPDYGTGEVADHAIGLMLALRRGIAAFHAALTADPVSGWDWTRPPLIRRNAGAMLGIVGMGRIGTACALRAKAFGMEVVFHDPYQPSGYELAIGCRRADSLGELLAAADIVSLHCPETEETRGLIDAAALARMKPGAILINTARGGVVDPEAVAAALESGQLGGAGLDVLPQEPPDPAHPLIRAYREGAAWARGRLVLSPHAAFYSPQSWRDMREKAAETVRRFLVEGRLRNCVNAEFLADPGLKLAAKKS